MLYLTFEARKMLIESFVFSNLNYYPLVWSFMRVKAIKEIESEQKRVLSFLFDSYEISYKFKDTYIGNSKT